MTLWRGQVWRLTFADRDPLAPVTAPVGRFHHDGQTAIYTSLTPAGCGVAIRRYLRPDDGPRVLHPLRVDARNISDMRNTTDPTSIVWQDIHAAGSPAPTWLISDRARDRGAQGLLYRSRTRPQLVHLALFAPAVLTLDGPPVPWAAAV